MSVHDFPRTRQEMDVDATRDSRMVEYSVGIMPLLMQVTNIYTCLSWASVFAIIIVTNLLKNMAPIQRNQGFEIIFSTTEYGIWDIQIMRLTWY